MRDFGDSFSRFGNVTFLTGDSPEDLQRMLRELRIPFEIIAVYAQGNKHVAWINPIREVIKKLRKIKENSDG